MFDKKNSLKKKTDIISWKKTQLKAYYKKIMSSSASKSKLLWRFNNLQVAS
jgi:hypothetical protein